MPADTPAPMVEECRAYGAEVVLVDGLIHRCGREAHAWAAETGAFDVSTLREPYRIEGKKTMAYEIVEQMGGVPDVIVYPTGGGTGLIGMWKAFEEMRALGWIQGRGPRMVSVQAEGCAPIVRAFETGAEQAAPWEDARTDAVGLRVPTARGDFLILRAVRESRGTALAVPDQEILRGARDLATQEGISAAPEGGATIAALRALLPTGAVRPEDRVVCFNTGSALKYLHLFG
jgi:threonine synthase